MASSVNRAHRRRGRIRLLPRRYNRTAVDRSASDCAAWGEEGSRARRPRFVGDEVGTAAARLLRPDFVPDEPGPISGPETAFLPTREGPCSRHPSAGRPAGASAPLPRPLPVPSPARLLRPPTPPFRAPVGRLKHRAKRGFLRLPHHPFRSPPLTPPGAADPAAGALPHGPFAPLPAPPSR